MYLVSVYTTKGRIKKINQDSALVMEAETDRGSVLFAAVSDGMGGLAKGEEASARMVRALSAWFETVLPELLSEGLTEETFRRSIRRVILQTCDEIREYAAEFGAECGTTLAGVLLVGKEYYIVNVGDSRVYIYGETLEQITKDQSYVQREIDAGRMTEEEAKTHKMRSMLLQCIGASDVVIPDYFCGTLNDDDAVLLCSDGFRHVISRAEMESRLSPALFRTEEEIYAALETIGNESMSDGERDNITAIYLKE